MLSNKPKLIVVKLGGNIVADHTSLRSIVTDINRLKTSECQTILVHGGGIMIDERLRRQGIQPSKQFGLRVTDAATLLVVKDVLAEVNDSLTGTLTGYGLACHPFPPATNILSAEKKMVLTEDGSLIDLGFIGKIKHVEALPLLEALVAGKTPLVAPVAASEGGTTYLNVNADEVASAIASALDADGLLLVSDVPGVSASSSRDDTTKLPLMRRQQWQQLVKEGIIHGGMLPKLATAFEAIDMGVKSVQILDGREPNAIYRAITEPGSTGTVIAA